MTQSTKCIEVRTPDGKPILCLHLYEKGPGGNGRTNGKGSGNHRTYANQARRQNGNEQNGNGQQDADAMSDAQKRYLFRILADQGLEGDAALAHLKDRLGVETLSNATKREVSALIEELLGSPTAE